MVRARSVLLCARILRELDLTRHLHTVALVLLLAGCTHAEVRDSRRQVGLEMILPPSAEQVRLKEKEVFLLPSPIEADLPAYPDATIDAPTVIVCAEIVVSEEGSVASVSQIDNAQSCERTGSDLSAKFMPSVVAALRAWSFAAAAICRYETAETECADNDGAGHAPLTPVAVRLAYKIEFVQSNGVKSVRKREIGSGSPSR